MFSYVESKEALINNLLRDANVHDARDYWEIGRGYENLDDNLPRVDSAEFDNLHIAFEFWGGWIDARNHDWKYYKGIKRDDWPILARRISKALSEDEEITDPLVLAHFDFRAH